MVKNSLRFVPRKDKKAVVANLKTVYTATNAIESLNRSLRKVTKNRGSFPNDESALKLLYLALRNISKKWTMPIRLWKQALNQFVILFPGRLVEDYPMEL